MKKKIIASITIIIILIVGLIGCMGSNNIVGKWKPIETSTGLNYIRFYSDETLESSLNHSPYFRNGTYKINDDLLTILNETGHINAIYEMEFKDDDTLYLTDIDSGDRFGLMR